MTSGGIASQGNDDSECLMRDIMKKILLASSALVMAASAAAASERVAATLNGYFHAGVGYTDSDFIGGGSGINDVTLLRDGEIHFNFRGTSDNGLTFVGRVELEAAGNTGAGNWSDRSWAGIRGAFGAVEVGNIRHASYDMATGPLFVGGAHIGHYDAFNRSGPGASNNRFGRPVGLFYNTPVFSGFQARLSYHPDATAQRAGGTQTVGADDVISVGLNYRFAGDGFAVQLSGGYDHISGSGRGFGGQNATGDEDAFTAGIRGEFAGIVLGGLYKERLLDTDSTDWLINATYGTGPWIFGAGYVYSDFGNAAANGDRDRYAGWVSYALSPGVTVQAGVEHTDERSGGPSGTAALAWMTLTF